MARGIRIQADGFYHVVTRGVANGKVFLDDEDHLKFLELAIETRSVHRFDLDAYCLMDNQYHFLVKITQNNLALVMRQINHRYAIYFNKKYNRIGHLWQGRYKSWYVTEKKQLNILTRYIEQIPVRAGVTSAVGEFQWSSNTTAEENSLEENKLLGAKSLEIIEQLHRTKLVKRSDGFKPNKAISLEKFFENYDPDLHLRNKQILKAVKEGYRQAEIANYLQLSDVAISKIMKSERVKESLFNKLKDKGIFWSYDKNVDYFAFSYPLFIEYALKYGDFEDLVLLFKYFGKKLIGSIWNKVLKSDQRFVRLNVLIARLFLGMEVDGQYFKEQPNERFEKLRLLAS